ncbi:MAG: VWA-like domain-containing protein [Pseudomonadota bacterium]
MSGHSARATVALQKLVETDPAFGALALWCEHCDAVPETVAVLVAGNGDGLMTQPVTREIAPAYTDGQKIYYGSEFEAWTLDEQVAVCAHEILHVALQHAPRSRQLAERLGPEFSSQIFNIAADALVNAALVRAGYVLPNPHVSLKDVLCDIVGSGLSPTEALKQFDVESLYRAIADAVEAGEAAASALRRAVVDLQLDVFPSETSGPEASLEAAEWEQRLDRAMAVGALTRRGLGQLAGDFADIPRTRTPWERILRNLVTKSVTTQPQPAFGRPTSRWLARESDARTDGRPMPGFEPAIAPAPTGRARVAVCIDVSGSISGSTMRRFGGEIGGIARRTGAEIHLVVFDDGIQLSRRLDGTKLQDELALLTFRKGGGTSFVEPIAEALTVDPSIIVVLTDLLGPHGSKPGKVPVLWACPNPMPPKPPFGRVIVLAA